MRCAASRLALLALLAGALMLGASPAMAQIGENTTTTVAPATPQEVPAPLVEVPAPPEVPDVSISVDSENEGLSQTVTIILMLTVAGVAPGILLLTTSFTRFAIVLGLTRNAIGVQTIPPSQVLIGLSLLLTVFVMGPIFGDINDNALQPLLAGEIEQDQAFEEGFAPLRDFMLSQTRPEDLRLFMGLSDNERPATPEEVSATTLIPAFVISELRAAFIIGFIIFVPFLVIDLIVAAVLMSMGMVMLPPVFISLPLKLLLFVLVDGWAMIIGSVVQSVQGVT
jgi:flagellar biosynthetic protein FliP